MPTRILKDSIKRSDQVDKLSWFEEVVYYRLILTADDYGCADGRAVVLKSDLFPTKEKLTPATVNKAIGKLVEVGLIIKYEVNGMPYLYFPTWEKHQRVRNKHRKYPQPPDGNLSANCCQTPADRLSESESNIESESNTNPVAETEARDDDDSRPDFNTVEVYAANNLSRLSPGNMQELADFKTELSDELIRYAIDVACANGKSNYSYARAIMQRYAEAGYKTVGDAKAAEEKHSAQKGTAAGSRSQPANFAQRKYTAEESEKDYMTAEEMMREFEAYENELGQMAGSAK